MKFTASVLEEVCHVTPFGDGTSLVALDGTILDVGNASNGGGAVTVLLMGVNVGTVLTGTVIGSDVETGAGIGSAVDGIGADGIGSGTYSGTDVEIGVGGSGAE